ncbi:MAG: hypothetical protein H7138_01010 [Myxococcales bacterium]|nr:hypothetical protein [Myxococcales bacterium]
MTRMLFWNVEHFNQARFYSISANNDVAAGMTQAQSAAQRVALLQRVIVAANPDVIVIVEVTVGKHLASRLAQNITAPLQLLDWLRNAAPLPVQSPTWRLVPPLALAGTPNNAGLESVGVFYRGQTGTVDRFFTGPNVWPGGVNGEPALPGAAVPAAYGVNTRMGQNVDLNTLLVPPLTAARTIPAGALHNGNGLIAENTVAARWRLRTMVLGAPGPNVNFGVARPPLMVTLTERTGVGALRNLTVFGVHARATGPGALGYITTLSTTYEVASDLGADETRMIGGDFNANLLQNDGRVTTAYNPLTNHQGGYRLLLQPTAPPPLAPAELAAWKGYFGTHINPVDDPPLVNNARTSRFLWSDGVTGPSYYPAYRYQSNLYYSIDNVLVRPFDDTRNYQTSILNTVLSAPLDALQPVPAGAPQGTLAIGAEIATIAGAAAWPQAPLAARFVNANANLLIAWPRYGHIVSTSDHFALFTDV